MRACTYDVTRPPLLVTSEGMRVLRPEEVDMETQTVRLIPNERFMAKAPPMEPPVKKPPVLRSYGGGTSSSSSRPSEALERGQAAMMSSPKAAGTATGLTPKAAGSTLEGISKSAAPARTSGPMGPPTMEGRQQAATALFYSDHWDHLSIDGHRRLVRTHGSEKVQRFHPERRSCPKQISDLEFMRVTWAWKGKEWHRRVVTDSDRRRAELEGPGSWTGFSLFLIRAGLRSM